MKTRAKIFLVEDHPTVRLGLRFVIKPEPDLLVCGEAVDRADALTGIGRERPDLAIVDLHLNNSSGLELIKDLRAQQPRLPVLVLTMDDGADAACLSFRAGASGFLSKDAGPSVLLGAIRSVLNGKRYFPPSLAGQLAERMLDGGKKDGASGELLSDREAEIFAMLARGSTAGQIACALHLSTSTVHTYCERLKQKFGLRTERELIATAVRCCRCPECAHAHAATAAASRATSRESRL